MSIFNIIKKPEEKVVEEARAMSKVDKIDLANKIVGMAAGGTMIGMNASTVSSLNKINTAQNMPPVRYHPEKIASCLGFLDELDKLASAEEVVRNVLIAGGGAAAGALGGAAATAKSANATLAEANLRARRLADDAYRQGLEFKSGGKK